MILGKYELKKRLKAQPPLVEGMIDPDLQIQPAGIDLTVAEIYRFTGPGQLDFTNRERRLAELSPVEFNRDGWAILGPGYYLVRFNETVNMPLDLAAIGKPRSSLLRMGAFMVSAVWDPGYRGRSISLLAVGNPRGIRIKRGARIIQLVFIKVLGETTGYQGIYQGEQ